TAITTAATLTNGSGLTYGNTASLTEVSLSNFSSGVSFANQNTASVFDQLNQADSSNSTAVIPAGSSGCS
ncbi:MAG: hypothetical protein P4M12_11520, partial [Gammaproteobacteria bacterium]|nr:hypothetical protein [Gammaproteobacteria bacterium]